MKLNLLVFLFIVAIAGACTFVLWEPAERTYTIPKGQHAPAQALPSRYYTRPTELHLTVTFDSTCIYDIGPVDQGDWNKLWGYGFLGTANQGIEAAHRVDSFRFSWRWNLQTQRIEIGAYVYDQGNRLPDLVVAEAMIGQPVTLDLTIDYKRGQYRTMEKFIPFGHRKSLAYALGPFFGGNQTAPHFINIRIRD
jgi:hypothetical protein